MKQVEVNRV